jgi:LCP family protein required for cell wall assembly
MANSRPPDDRYRRTSSGRGRDRVSNEEGLAALGQQASGPKDQKRGAGYATGGNRKGPGSGPGSGQRPVANEAGLAALGAQIERKGRRQRPLRRSGKARWSRRRKVVTVVSSVVVLVLVVAGAGYAYLRYEFRQIKTAPCANCVAVADGAPFNVLVIGSDTRQGETAAEAKQFGNPTTAAGQRSDTIKIIHVDPKTGTASTLSIPRDTLVVLSGVPSSSGVSSPNKINAAFASGPNDPNPSGTGANGLVKTIENTLGIPISHWIVINFFGLMDMVNALHGINMDVPYPVRDYGDCNANGIDENCTGLNIATAGCQTLSGAEALSLSRSRHFEYFKDGEWMSDLSSDIGRIERQDLIIEAVIDKAKSTYNPLSVASFISSLAHDVTLDNKLGPTTLISLAERYHALSGSSLNSFTLPTIPGVYAPYSNEDVEIVEEPQASQMIATFLGGAPESATTPPLDQYGNPETVTASAPTTTAPPSTGSTSKTGGSSSSSGATTTAVPSFDPRPC